TSAAAGGAEGVGRVARAVADEDRGPRGVHAVGEAGAELGDPAADLPHAEGRVVGTLATHDEDVVVRGGEVPVGIEEVEGELAEEPRALTATHVAVSLAEAVAAHPH